MAARVRGAPLPPPAAIGLTEQPLWAVHVSAVDGRRRRRSARSSTRPTASRFLGRGRTPADPAALEPGAGLSGTSGPVLDPIFSLRRRLRLEPGGLGRRGVHHRRCRSREEALTLADQFREAGAATRAFELAWAHSQVEHRHHDRLGAGGAPVPAAGVAHRLRRAAPCGPSRRSCRRTARVSPSSWRYGISGDRPIVLARIADVRRAAAGAPAPGRTRVPAAQGAGVRPGPARRAAGELPRRAEPPDCRTPSAPPTRHERIDQPGGIFVRKASQMTEDDQILLQAARGSCWSATAGSLASQLDQIERHDPPARPAGRRRASRAAGTTSRSRRPDLLVRQRAGRLHARRPRVLHPGAGPCRRRRPAATGRSPVPCRRLRTLRLPPAPWINVIANPAVGFLVSEGGSGYTWAGNSQSNRLTPWSNDPVSDPPGEVVYLRDEETGEFWSPTPLPVPSWAADAGPPRPGVHGLRAEHARPGPRADPVRPARRSGQADPPEGQERGRPAAPAVGDLLRRVGAGAQPRHRGHARRDRAGLRDRRPAGPQRLPHRLLRRRGVRRRRPAAAHADRRPHRVPRPSRLARRPGRAGPPGPLRPRRRRPRPLRRPARPRSSCPGEETEIVFLLGEADDADAAARPGPPLPRAGQAAQGTRGRQGRAGTTCWAPCRCTPPTRP